LLVYWLVAQLNEDGHSAAFIFLIAILAFRSFEETSKNNIDLFFQECVVFLTYRRIFFYLKVSVVENYRSLLNRINNLKKTEEKFIKKKRRKAHASIPTRSLSATSHERISICK
jgi:hypothetical protein